MRTIRRIWDGLISFVWKFGLVGLVGLVVDVGVFNLLRTGMLGGDHFLSGPIGAGVVAVAAATIVNWVGNRYWTFREHRRSNVLLELFEFSIVSVAGLLISVACLWFSHYLLGFDSLFADNISKNVIGLALGTMFRFVLYRYWVFGHHRKDGLTARRHREIAAARPLFEHEETPSRQAA